MGSAKTVNILRASAFFKERSLGQKLGQWLLGHQGWHLEKTEEEYAFSEDDSTSCDDCVCVLF